MHEISHELRKAASCRWPEPCSYRPRVNAHRHCRHSPKASKHCYASHSSQSPKARSWSSARPLNESAAPPWPGSIAPLPASFREGQTLAALRRPGRTQADHSPECPLQRLQVEGPVRPFHVAQRRRRVAAGRTEPRILRLL